MLSFDQLLSKKIHFGNGQIYQFAILSLIQFLNGFSIVFLTMLVAVQQNEWGLTTNQIMMFNSIYYFGMLVGFIASGYFSNWYGRKLTLTVTMIGTLICILIHINIKTYYECLLVRFLFGFSYGISALASIIICGEIIPLSIRGRIVVSIQLIFLFGIFYLFICYLIFMESLIQGNWKAIFIMKSFPTFLCVIGCIFWLEESPRYYLASKQYSLCFQKLDKMGYLNNSDYIPLNTQEVCSKNHFHYFNQKNQLIYWQNNLNQKQKSSSIADLFSGQRKYITINLWIIFFTWNIQCVSIFILLPFFFQDQEKTIGELFIPYLFELPATIIIIMLIDSKQYGGRKMSINVSLLLFILAEFLLYIYRKKILMIGIIIIRMTEKACWVSFNQLKIESYSTINRSLGVGMTEGIGKIAASICSFFIFPVFNIDPYLPFLVLGLFSFITVICVAIHPIDLTQEALDEFEQDKIKK